MTSSSLVTSTCSTFPTVILWINPCLSFNTRGTLERFIGVLRSEGGPEEHTSISPEGGWAVGTGTPTALCSGEQLFFKFLFIFNCAGSSLSCEGVSLHGFCRCRAWTLGTWATVAVLHGLRCSAACGIFPGPGTEPIQGSICLPDWQTDS